MDISPAQRDGRRVIHGGREAVQSVQSRDAGDTIRGCVHYKRSADEGCCEMGTTDGVAMR